MAAFVPKFENDLFISYAHEDDKGWVQAFEEALRDEVSRRLGLPISVWKDTQQIRAGENWQDDIEAGIRGAAAFVAIVSPRYQNSKWCANERLEFQKQFVDPAKAEAPAAIQDRFIKSGRFFKAIRVPWANNGHRLFLEAIQDCDFYKTGEGGFQELRPGSKDFSRAIRKLADGVEPQLRRMRRGSQRVHIAWPIEECQTDWTQLHDELRSKGYDVQPTGPRDLSYADKLLLEEMEAAVLSVHILGSSFDEFTERVALLAADHAHQMMFWTAKGADATTDQRQRAFIDAIRRGVRPDDPKREWPSGWSLIADAAIRKFIDAVVTKLRPQTPSAMAPAAGGNPTVYIVHDATTAEDAKIALELKDLIAQKEKMNVFVSRADLTSPTELKVWHENLLRSCDGVLLYRNCAPEGWWNQLAPEVILAEKRLEREPIKSRAFLLPKPPTWEVGPDVKVIPYHAPLQVTDLEPFLVPLRQ